MGRLAPFRAGYDELASVFPADLGGFVGRFDKFRCLNVINSGGCLK
jgi:hypothetical protein